ncbi:ABC-type transporter, integral membrane subunit [Pseudonocardia dioxanivorans CB1190]|uniref:ABC-type transporter, integral membrane subunit n=1 Tax=Pseudonocardia dioxanivorans (strain ATCC 55486 / DSM 44775 / JCM 13855 / CB1190) TaxID=675635 RepID=F4CZ02_PSEUX|nr:branched-chain amino acid ABC transporter permease [Pseudonocardia dioxanivorans]AEA24293.1 ABC-type transporter, integral membrane subunit [Pseudonocardia dioxanivorans CB1190]
MDKLLQLVVAGLVTGSIYGLIATGYAVLYTATGFVNFALGAQAMLGGYLAYVYFPAVPQWVRIVISLVVGAVVSVVSWNLLYKWAARRAMLAAVIMSFALAIVFEEIIRLSAGGLNVPAPSPFGRTVFQLGAVTISAHQLAVVVVSAVLFTGLVVMLGSKRGAAVRAMFADAETAEVLGIRTARLTTILFAVSGVFAAVAGILAAPLLTLSPYMGLNLALIGFVGAILGGLGRIGTAIAGSILLGLLEAFFAGYVSADFRTALVYAVFVLVLVIRPAGLLGRVAKVKV